MNEQMTADMAARLHSGAIRLLRLVRKEDEESAISAPRLSALSVITHAGPLSLNALAAAEQVRAPTMSRLVDGLVNDGLATREPDPRSRRSVSISATEQGRSLLEEARKRRVQVLTERLRGFADSEKRALLRGVELIEQLTRSP